MGRTLRVWESGKLHGQTSGNFSTVEWTSEEYDFVSMDDSGDLIVAKEITYGSGQGTVYRREVVAHIKAGYWFKYQLDEEEVASTQPILDEKNLIPSETYQNNSYYNGDGKTRTDIESYPQDENPISLSSFARTTDPFDEAPVEPPTVVRPDVGMHTAPDDTEHVQNVLYLPPDNPMEHHVPITSEMRARVLERLGERARTIGEKDEDPEATSPTNTSLLGLQDTTQLPILGNEEVFKIHTPGM